MIRIHKNLANVPASLNNNKTELHWNDSILYASWKGSKKTESEQYKEDDTKQALKLLYNNKCAFCEKSQLDTYPHVEHFRPKKKYYWLGFSWDNLLWACAKCNLPKGEKFDVLGTRVTYTSETFADIHTLSAGYDTTEQPEFFNPETADPEPHLIFNTNGEISSQNRQVQYTIDTCKLRRDELNQARRILLTKIEDDFNQKLLRFNKKIEAHRINYQHIAAQLVDDLEDCLEPLCKAILNNDAFSAWQKYILKNYVSFLYKPTNRIFNACLDRAIRKIRENPTYNAIFR
jgi:uncharacterized protein (TIGR02646 family)